MKPVALRTGMVDVLHDDAPHVIAVGVLETQRGIVLIDPGPESTLRTLDHELLAAGTSVEDVQAILLTHIHLDHAGATGSILRVVPDARVYVHPKGAPHLIDPSRLMRSARRLFGDAMDRLWGRCLPVPAERIVGVDREQTLDLGGLSLEVVHTPGHADHHMSFFDSTTGIAFVGDAAGARIGEARLVLPATPPPDIEPALILSSLDRIMAWKPKQLFLTHFGPQPEPEQHVDQLRERLPDWSDRVRRSLDDTLSDDKLATRFGREVAVELRAAVGEFAAVAYERAAAPSLSWYGLARYWRKRGQEGQA